MSGVALWFLNHSLNFGSCWGEVPIPVTPLQTHTAPLCSISDGSVTYTPLAFSSAPSALPPASLSQVTKLHQSSIKASTEKLQHNVNLPGWGQPRAGDSSADLPGSLDAVTGQGREPCLCWGSVTKLQIVEACIRMNHCYRY